MEKIIKDKFQILSKIEMKAILGGASITVSCGSSSLTCQGDSVSGTDEVGCSETVNGVTTKKDCPQE